jgi:Flp pilus assembly protein TadG
MRDDRGSVAMLFALMLVPMIAVVGLAIDYGNASSAERKAQAAMDAANLAAAVAASDYMRANPDASEAEAAKHAATTGEKFFEANNSASDALDVDYKVSVAREDNNWVVNSSFSGTYDVKLAGLLGLESWKVSRSSTSIYNKPFVPVLDIAMCIDATGSMQPTIDAVRSNALSFYDRLVKELEKNDAGRFVQIRVRPIYYRDFAVYVNVKADWKHLYRPLIAPVPFVLPSQRTIFEAFVASEKAGGGGDHPENGLECVNEAMDTPWVKVGDMVSGSPDPVTHVFPMIVIWTDAQAHPLAHEKSLAEPLYPSAAKMPRTAAEFTAKWNDKKRIDQKNKQIVFFGNPYTLPQFNGWSVITSWKEFSVGGTLKEGNTDMVPLIAKNVAGNIIRARVTN